VLFLIEGGLKTLRETPGVYQYNIIYDRTDYTRENFDLEVAKKLMEISSHAPERIHQIFVVKPNWLYYTLFALIKPFMHPDTVAKIKLCSSDPSKELLQLFEPDQLLKEYGGTGTYEYKWTTPTGRPKLEPDTDLENLTLQETFDKVSQKVASIEISEENEKKLYGLYQQATQGDNISTQPWALQYDARTKWDAWTACKGMTKDDAMEHYVELYTELRSTQ